MPDQTKPSDREGAACVGQVYHYNSEDDYYSYSCLMGLTGLSYVEEVNEGVGIFRLRAARKNKQSKIFLCAVIRR